MNDLRISDLLSMQEELWEKNQHSWNPIEPQYAKDSYLWMMEEIGECIALFKKKGHDTIVNDPSIRALFCEEMIDVLMYYSQILLRMGISSQELASACLNKHERNMKRNFQAEYKDKFQEK